MIYKAPLPSPGLLSPLELAICCHGEQRSIAGLTSGSEDTKKFRYASSELRPGAEYMGIAWPEKWHKRKGRAASKDPRDHANVNPHLIIHVQTVHM